MTNEQKIINQRLASIVRQRWKSKKAMATELEISNSYLNEILNGKTKISGRVMEKLANAGVDVIWILTGEKFDEKERMRDSTRDQFEEIWHRLPEPQRRQALRLISCLGMEKNMSNSPAREPAI